MHKTNNILKPFWRPHIFSNCLFVYNIYTADITQTCVCVSKCIEHKSINCTLLTPPRLHWEILQDQCNNNIHFVVQDWRPSGQPLNHSTGHQSPNWFIRIHEIIVTTPPRIVHLSFLVNLHLKVISRCRIYCVLQIRVS